MTLGEYIDHLTEVENLYGSDLEIINRDGPLTEDFFMLGKLNSFDRFTETRLDEHPTVICV